MGWEAGARIITPGTLAPTFEGLNLDDQEVSLEHPMSGKVWLIFYRYARCPLCNLHFYQVNQIFPALREKGIRVVTIFCSEKKYFPPKLGHLDAPETEIVADPAREIYRKYGVEDRFFAMFSPGTFAGFREARANDYEQPLNIDNGLFQIPAHFLIESDGTVATAYYGSHYNDHLAWDIVRNFSGVEFSDPSTPKTNVPVDRESTGFTKSNSAIVPAPNADEAFDYTGGLGRKDYDTYSGVQGLTAESETRTLDEVARVEEANSPELELASEKTSVTRELDPPISESDLPAYQRATQNFHRKLPQDFPAGEWDKLAANIYYTKMTPETRDRIKKQLRQYPQKAREHYKSGTQIDSAGIGSITERLALMAKFLESTPNSHVAPIIRAIIDYITDDTVREIDFSNLENERKLIDYATKAFQLES